MSSTHSPLDLNCTLTRYLEETSSIDTGGKSAFAAAMLADLGFFNKNQAHPSVGNLQDLLGILITGGYMDTLSEMSTLCGTCCESGGCFVGSMILNNQEGG